VAQVMQLEAELGEVVVEIGEVREALQANHKFLGMSGQLLQEYFVELAKKQNLLRLTISRLQHWPIQHTRGMKFRRASKANGSGSMQLSGLTDPQRLLESSPSGISSPLLPRSASSISRPLRLASKESVGSLEVGRLRSVSFEQVSSPASVRFGGDFGSALEEPSPALPTKPGKAEAFLQEVDCSNLAAVLQFMQACSDDARAQRLAVHAIGRLARDEAQLQPLCLAAAAAIVTAATSFREDLQLQRLAVASLSSVAYSRQVAALVLSCALPAILSTMILHAEDHRLQGLALEGLARLAQAGRTAVINGIVQAVLHNLGDQDEAKVRKVCCESLLRLRESEICDQEEVLAVLLPMAESQPANLHLQRRACELLQQLLAMRAIDEGCAVRMARPLMSTQWAHLLARFVSAGTDELVETSSFHARVQRLFHEEVGKHFEYEAAERTLHLLRRKAPGVERIREVLRCLVENLEDYQHRVRTRKIAWDDERRCLAPLDAELYWHLSNEAVEHLEGGLYGALASASTAEEGPSVEAALSRRAAVFRNDCAALLAVKTEMTQNHQERMESLRREVMLYEAVEYLELNVQLVSQTQIRTTLHLLDLMDGDEAPEGLDRLRSRVIALSGSAGLKANAAPAG